jgi:hypothetical protein
MDGAVSGMLESRDEVVRISSRIGDDATAKASAERRNGQVVITSTMRRQIEGAAIVEGQAWVHEIEAKCRQVLLNAHDSAQKGLPDVPGKVIGKQLRGVIEDMLEPSESGPRSFAKRTKPAAVRGKEAYRRARAKRWKKGDPPLTGKARKTLKRQSVSRMRTGWNRWYNRGVVQQAQVEPEVVYLQFSLGRAKQHTEICLARQGWVVRKGDPRLALETPPLHWDCRSRWIPVTREAAKAYKIKRWTPKEVKDPEYEPQSGFGGFGR